MKVPMHKTMTAEEIRSKYFNPSRGRDLRRLPEGASRRTFVVSEMNERHHNIARLAALGLKNKQIAQKTGLQKEYISNITNSPIVKAQIAILRGADNKKVVDVTKRIADICNKSVDIFEKILNEGELDDDIEGQRLQLKAAEGILNRGGHSPIKNIDIRNTTTHLTGDDILKIKQRALDAGACIPDEVEEEVIEAEIINQ